MILSLPADAQPAAVASFIQSVEVFCQRDPQ